MSRPVGRAPGVARGDFAAHRSQFSSMRIRPRAVRVIPFAPSSTMGANETASMLSVQDPQRRCIERRVTAPQWARLHRRTIRGMHARRAHPPRGCILTAFCNTRRLDTSSGRLGPSLIPAIRLGRRLAASLNVGCGKDCRWRP